MLVLGLGAALVGGYFLLRTSFKGEKEQSVCALVIDRTGSTNDTAAIANYQKAATEVVSGCRNDHAELAVYYFTQAGPQLQRASATALDLWLVGGQKKPTAQDQLDAAMKTARRAITKAFAQPAGSQRGSNILASLYQASGNLNTQAATDHVSRRYLILLTDGIQLSSDVTVQSFTSPSSPVQPLLDNAAQVGLVPALNGAQVSFIGVHGGTSGAGDQLPDWFENKVSQFWHGLVAAGGGRVCPYLAATPDILPPSGC